jgi:membrane fusion protein, multidrug efflux system
MFGLRLHQVLALLVLLAAAAWVLTGEFSHTGSENDEAEETASPPEVSATQRTVLVVRLDQERYSRAIRVAGRTEPDKTSLLAARESGIIRALPAIDGQYVSAGSVLLRLERPEKLAAVETAKALLAQRQAQVPGGGIAASARRGRQDRRRHCPG